MDYLEKNMKSIKKYKSFLYESIEKMDNKSHTSSGVDEIQSVLTRDGSHAMVIKVNSQLYRLNSMYSPVQEAKRWVEQYSFKHLSNIISMYGFGNGMFARAILEKMGENDFLLIYEPRTDIFFHVLSNYDITDILGDKRVSIAVEDINEFEFHNTLRVIMNITNMSSQIMCVYPNYDKIFAESCVAFWKEIKESYQHTKINVNTEIVFGKKFIENALNNIRYIKNSNTLLELKKDIPDDITAIVVAAGPSVEKNIDELKRAKGKSIIFAVDRILDYLLDAGLEPDFVFTIDPMKPVQYFSRREDVIIPLVAFIEANHEILLRHKGKKIIANCNGFMDKVYIDNKKNPPRMNSSASVATLAFTACVDLGIKRVILVGQDLAYDGSVTHAGGVEEKYGEAKEVMIEDINGNMVKSRYDWKEFVTWYQDMIIMFPEVEVIDAKVKGAKIKGATIMPLKEAVDAYCNVAYDSKAMLEHLEPTFSEAGITYIEEFLKNNLKIIDKIKKKSIDAVKLCNQLLKENNISPLNIKEVKRIERINKYIAKQPIYSLIDYYITVTAAQQLLDIYNLTEDVNEDNIKTLEKSIHVFEAIIEAANFIKPRLEKNVDDFIKAE